ncbi:MAG: hypothetical protein AAF675_15295 [Pseudomonadota bacterium]
MDAKSALSLFRFNTLRPAAAQPGSGRQIQYSGPLTEFLLALQKAEPGEAVAQLSRTTKEQMPFFRFDAFAPTEFGPLITGMERLQAISRDPNANMLDQVKEAFASVGGSEAMEKLVNNPGPIWDHYIVSLIERDVAPKQRAALVDALRAAALIRDAGGINNAAALRALLHRSPVLPGWLITKITGKLRQRLPFVIGVTDLMVVKEEWESYRRAAIAHVENVMGTEERTRTLRQLDRRESITFEETERTEVTEEESTASTHSAMVEEIHDVISQQTETNAASLISSYGPQVLVDVYADFNFTTASEETTFSSQEYAQDLVERAAATVTERNLSSSKLTILAETEETHVQHYTNTAPGAEHVIGVYRHLDQIWRAQVYNYGRRLMLDFVVPEPSATWRESRKDTALPEEQLVPPPEFTVSAQDITREEYQNLALEWGASSLPAPPPLTVSVSKAVKLEIPQFNLDEASSISMVLGELQIPVDYVGVQAVGRFHGDRKQEGNALANTAHWLVNGTVFTPDASVSTVTLESHTGPFEFGVYTDNYEGGVMSVRVDCQLTAEGEQKWQNAVYDALKAANDRAWDRHRSALSNRQALKRVEQETTHPDTKRRIIREELKRGAISVLTEQNFEQAGSTQIDTSAGVPIPQIDFQEARLEGRLARFFEEAFEWEEMTYLCYPYFWARRSEWYDLMAARDPDFQFNGFLSAGAARVNLAVRPGFEAAVLWFLATGQVWFGGPTPVVSDPMYVALIDEIVESKGRSLIDPEPVGDSWTYALPTNLVVLDPDASLIPPD